MADDAVLLYCGIVLTAVSGLPSLLSSRRSLVGQWVSTALAVVGCLCGLIAAWRVISHPAMAALHPPAYVLKLPSPIAAAPFVLAADSLSAFFLVPIFLISLLGSLYGLDYWKQTEHPQNGRK